jgi:hypothetical protein
VLSFVARHAEGGGVWVPGVALLICQKDFTHPVDG